MIEIRYLRAESGANKFGTCNCCGKSSGEDPLMISVKFSYYGHGTLICLCDDCKKKLMEALPPALPELMKIDLSRCSEENWERIKKEWANTPITAITAEPERIKGHWIAMERKNLFRCSECDAVIYSEYECDRNEFHKFCGRCGADMREVTE